jgi:hypothetical protein
MLETFSFACALSNHMFSMCEQSKNNFKYKRVNSNLKYIKVDNKVSWRVMLWCIVS